MKHFPSTLRQLYHSESQRLVIGLLRHFAWKLRSALGLFPCELRISESRFLADGPSGVPALINLLGVYDFNNMSFVKYVLRTFGGCMVDVGANLGSYTLIAAEARKGAIVSIEPHPGTYRNLLANIRLNACSNVVALNVAVSNADGVLTITDIGESAINRIVAAASYDGASVPVPCRTLDGVCEDSRVIPTLVKIDVEGHEVQVLEGFRRTSAGTEAMIVENGESPAVLEQTTALKFLGPWYVHFGSRSFRKTPQPRAEDPVFLKPQLCTRLVALGFLIEGL